MDYQSASSSLLPNSNPNPNPNSNSNSNSNSKPPVSSENQGPIYTLFGPLDASKYCWLFYILSVVGFVLLALVLIVAVVGLVVAQRSGKSAKAKQGAWVVFGGVMLISVQYAYLYFTNRLLYTMCSTSGHKKKGSGSAGVEGAASGSLPPPVPPASVPPFEQQIKNARFNLGGEVNKLQKTQSEEDAKRKAAMNQAPDVAARSYQPPPRPVAAAMNQPPPRPGMVRQ
jgi:hypothetical protein